MPSENKRSGGRKLILTLCLAIFTILVALTYGDEFQKGPVPMENPLETQNVNNDLLKANEEYLHIIQVLNEQLVTLQETSLIAKEESDEVIEWKRKIEDLQDFLEAKADDRTAFEGKIIELTGLLDQKNEELDKTKDEILVLNDQLSQLEELKGSLTQKREQLEQSQENLSQLENANNEKSLEIEKLVDLITELNGRSAQLKGDLQREENQRETLNSQIAELTEQNREFLDAQERLNSDLTMETKVKLDLESQITELHAIEKNSYEKIDNLLAQLDQTQTQNTDSFEKMNTLQSEWELLKSDYEEKSIQLQDTQDDLSSSEQTLDSLRHQLGLKEEMFRANLEIEEKKKQELREVVSEIQEQNAELTKKSHELAELQEKFNSQSKEFLATQQTLHESQEAFTDLKKTLIETTSQMAFSQENYQNAKVNFKRDKADILEALEENAETISYLEKQLSAKEVVMKSSMKQEENNKDLLRENINQLKDHNRQLLSRIEALERDLKFKSEQVNNLLIFERKYEEERKKRLIKEQVLKQLQSHLNQQKSSLNKLENTRQNLKDELELTQDSYSQLAKELAKRQPSPGIAQDHVMTDPQHHIVEEGETLMHISMKYYGTTRKWRRILESNRDVIADENKIQPGTEIIIP
ncbi:MAG: Chromosome partition protein Smc [Chlamydiae bacterium]|nr:Chromosome partition protein Smc [Chlamydiota bacterium]